MSEFFLPSLVTTRDLEIRVDDSRKNSFPCIPHSTPDHNRNTRSDLTGTLVLRRIRSAVVRKVLCPHGGAVRLKEAIRIKFLV